MLLWLFSSLQNLSEDLSKRNFHDIRISQVVMRDQQYGLNCQGANFLISCIAYLRSWPVFIHLKKPNSNPNPNVFTADENWVASYNSSNDDYLLLYYLPTSLKKSVHFLIIGATTTKPKKGQEMIVNCIKTCLHVNS